MAHPTVALALTLIRGKIDDPDSRRWTTATLCGYINFAQRRIVELIGRLKESGWFETTGTLAFSAGDETKALPADFQAAKIVELSISGGGRQVLYPVERRQMTSARGVPSGNVNTPNYYVRRSAADDGGGVLGLLPVDTANARTVYLTYMQRATDIGDTGSGNLTIHADFLEAIVLRASMAAQNDEEDSGSEYASQFSALMSHLIGTAQGSQDLAHTEQVGMEDFSDEGDWW